ncbi:hypothetical protein P5V15_003887 [Pogonomyrmex californicus]
MSRVPDVPDTSAMNGDRPMTIVRRMERERERMLGMTDEERAWRKKWLDAQKLDPDEPITPPGYYEEMYNPIRRFYMAPGLKFESMLAPYIGELKATVTRRSITRLMMSFIGIYCVYYHVKYNKKNWMKNGGFQISVSRSKMYPDNKDLKALYKTKGNEFYVNGFDKSPI